jgi:hypothetical protein
MTKLCIDCKHYKLAKELETLPGALAEYWHEYRQCWVLQGQQHPVIGCEISYIMCADMRMGPCGWDGKLWEAKDDSISHRRFTSDR